MKKKILALCIVFALSATAIIGGTLAYFTDTKEANNTFTVGNVKIDLTEPNWTTTGQKEAQNVYPGEILPKDPTVQNVGNNPCFVRIKVDNLDQFQAKGDIIYRTDNQDNALGTNWVKHTDGFYYYTQVLEVNASTDALFDQIVMPTALVGDEKAQDIVVTAQAVQAQGAKATWTDVQKMTVEELAAWFTTCGMK